MKQMQDTFIQLYFLEQHEISGHFFWIMKCGGGGGGGGSKGLQHGDETSALPYSVLSDKMGLNGLTEMFIRRSIWRRSMPHCNMYTTQVRV